MPFETQAESAVDTTAAASPAAESPEVYEPISTPDEPETVEAPSGGASADEFEDLADALEGDPRRDGFLARLRDVAQRRTEAQTALAEAQEQLRQFESYQPWIDPISRLAERGVTPEAFIEGLEASRNRQAQPQPQQAPTGPPTPEQLASQFEESLRARGVDPDALDSDAYELARFTWDQAQEMRQYREERQRDEARRFEERMDLEFRTVAEKHPLLKDSAFEIVLKDAFEVAEGKVPMQQIADKLITPIQKWHEGELARYAAGKKADAAAPVVTGGGAPPPASAPNFHSMTAEEQDQYMDRYFAAVTSPA